MKFSCTKENLHRALSITSHLTSKNINLPILQNILIKAQDGTIRFTTTNLEIAIGCTVRGKIEEDGELTIPSKLFFDYVSLLPHETVEISLDGDFVVVECANNETKIKGIASSEFPLVPEVHSNRTYQIAIEPLRKALSRVLFAVSTNESRPELTGVSARFAKGGDVVLAATDSYRLAETILPFQGEVGDEGDAVILPAKTLVELNRILSVFKDEVDAPTHITLGLSDNQAVFSYASVELTSRTIEGIYPDYKQIIPKDFRTTGVMSREDVVKAVKTASLFSRNGLYDVMLEFPGGASSILVKATDAMRGENTANCAATVTGDHVSVTLNYRYLLDGLNVLQSDKVRLQLIDGSNPVLVLADGVADQYLYLVMPIRQ